MSPDLDPNSSSPASSSSDVRLNTNEPEQHDYVTLGKVIGFFGVRGWVKVHSDTEPRENIVSYKRWWLSRESASSNGLVKKLADNAAMQQINREVVEVKNGKRSGKNVVAKIAGIDTREQAEVLIGKQIAVLRSMLPTLSEDEVYWTDLVGCVVVDINGVVFGPIKRLFETGANDVMVVADARGESETTSTLVGGEMLIPWIRPSVVTSIDLTQRRIVVDWDPEDLS